MTANCHIWPFDVPRATHVADITLFSSLFATPEVFAESALGVAPSCRNGLRGVSNFAYGIRTFATDRGVVVEYEHRPLVTNPRRDH